MVYPGSCSLPLVGLARVLMVSPNHSNDSVAAACLMGLGVDHGVIGVSGGQASKAVYEYNVLRYLILTKFVFFQYYYSYAV